MKNLTSLLVILFLVLAQQTMAQTQRENRDLRNFSSIKVGNAIEAELVKGDKNTISIIASGVDLDKVESNVADNSLELKLGRGNFRSSSVKVTITYVDIDEIQASSNAKVFVADQLAGSNVYLFATSNAYIEADVDATNLFIEASTNAKIAVNGKAENLDLKIFTKADVDGRKLTVDTAEVTANTAAKAEVTVVESIKGSAATAAIVTYKGDPRMIDVKTNTGGDIKRK
ncbi:head GIN domain-containing protein [Belliella pelovolcani]|uniref:head GIN domain-containing protein n=1 Tax=Belliella pelovolcani TaxID=529505 RepID=UPI00391C55A3